MLPSVIVLAALLAVALPAWAQTTTVGQTTGGATCTTAGAYFQAVPFSFKVPAGNWTLTSWSTDSNGAGSMALLVGEVDLVGWQVVAESAVQDLSLLPPGLHSFPASIAVKGGDYIGFWASGPTNCKVNTFSAGDTYDRFVTGSQPSVGDVFFAPSQNGAIMNISATLTRPDVVGGGGPRGGYCSATGDTMPDGSAISPGTFLNLEAEQPTTDSHYTGAVPAAYFEGIGITCDNQPVGYEDTGTKVNSAGLAAADALYEYWATN
jgi:hypothetical protein